MIPRKGQPMFMREGGPAWGPFCPLHDHVVIEIASEPRLDAD